MERLAGLCLAIALLGAALIYDGASRLINESDMSTTPLDTSLADLIASPPRGHQFVCVHELTPAETFANVTSRHDPIGTAYVPLKSTSGRYAIASTNGISAQFMHASESITGVARLGAVPHEAAHLLSCPGTDFNRVLIIDVTSTPPKAGGGWGILLAGLAMFVPLIALFGYALWRDRHPKRDPITNSPGRWPEGECPTALLANPPIDRTLEAGSLAKAVIALVTRERNDFSWSGWRNEAAAVAEIIATFDPAALATAEGRAAARLLFAPTGPLQELANSSGWQSEFLSLAKQADRLLTN